MRLVLLFLRWTNTLLIIVQMICIIPAFLSPYNWAVNLILPVVSFVAIRWWLFNSFLLICLSFVKQSYSFLSILLFYPLGKSFLTDCTDPFSYPSSLPYKAHREYHPSLLFSCSPVISFIGYFPQPIWSSHTLTFQKMFIFLFISCLFYYLAPPVIFFYVGLFPIFLSSQERIPVVSPSSPYFSSYLTISLPLSTPC